MLNFDEYEWNKITEKHKSLNVPMNVYLRTLCLRGFFKQSKYPKDLADSMSQLSRMGGLLKEFFNQTGGQHADLTAEILFDIRELISQIKKKVQEDDRETDTVTENGI